MEKKFQMVCGLWVTPDLSDMIAGHATPPRVEHSAVDFIGLHRALSDMFPCGPHVKIQVPNDTIDQASVNVRQNGWRGLSIRCEDFANALLKCAKKSSDDVIDVRRAWTSLHALSDRDFALPPVILPLVITATDFEDAMIWNASTRPSLGLPVFDVMDSIQRRNKRVDDSGFILPEFQQKLAKIFGCPFKRTAMLDQMVMDAAPSGRHM